MNSRLASLVVSLVLLATGTVAFAAAGTGPFKSASSTGSSAANSQYCPPGTPNAGKPKKPGPSACGEKPKCTKTYRLAYYKRYVRKVTKRRHISKKAKRHMRAIEACMASASARKKAQRFRKVKLAQHAREARIKALQEQKHHPQGRG